jgi:hypothetical protein
MISVLGPPHTLTRSMLCRPPDPAQYTPVVFSRNHMRLAQYQNHHDVMTPLQTPSVSLPAGITTPQNPLRQRQEHRNKLRGPFCHSTHYSTLVQRAASSTDQATLPQRSANPSFIGNAGSAGGVQMGMLYLRPIPQGSIRVCDKLQGLDRPTQSGTSFSYGLSCRRGREDQRGTTFRQANLLWYRNEPLLTPMPKPHACGLSTKLIRFLPICRSRQVIHRVTGYKSSRNPTETTS